MTKSKVLAVAGVAVAAIGITSVAYAASSDGDASSPAQARGFQTSSKPITDRERDLLNEHAQRVSSTGTTGPNADTVRGRLDEARLLLSSEGIRVSATQSADGGLCYVVTDGIAGTDYRTGCDTRFNEYGFTGALGEFSHDNTDVVFAGLAANDVTAITAHMNDGTEQKIALENNAFAWSSKERPASITFARAGKVLTLPISSEAEARAEIKENIKTLRPGEVVGEGEFVGPRG